MLLILKQFVTYRCLSSVGDNNDTNPLHKYSTNNSVGGGTQAIQKNPKVTGSVHLWYFPIRGLPIRVLDWPKPPPTKFTWLSPAEIVKICTWLSDPRAAGEVLVCSLCGGGKGQL